MNIRCFCKNLSTFCVLFLLIVPLFSSAQTAPQQYTSMDQAMAAAQAAAAQGASANSAATSTMNDLMNKYILQINQTSTDIMTKREQEVINPAKIREQSISNYMDIKTAPRNPSPGEIVHVTVESYLSDLNKATISWSMNGKVIDRGTGKTSFSFKNGASGETTRLTISLTTNTGEHITKELTFSPAGVTILWEADTYTPPFYKGKPLISPEARVRVIAIPDITNSKNALDANDLVFAWEKDGDKAVESSGYGKNTFSFTAPTPYEDTNVSTKVSSLDDAVKSEVRINLSLTQPFVLFYEKHPLLGTLYNHPLGQDLSLTKKEFSVNAEPYFFSNQTTSETSNLNYSWSLNSGPVDNPGKSIALRNETGAAGNSILSLSLRSTQEQFQTAVQSLTIHFTADAGAQPTF